MAVLKDKRTKTKEQKLLHQLKAGDPNAINSWVNQYEQKLLSFVLFKVGNQKDAEEIVQDTFLSCLKHSQVFRGESSIWTWMRRIASHEIADYFRKKYAKRVIRALPIGDFVLSQTISDSHETSEKVRQVLKRMSSDTAELIKLKYVDKKKVKDIAKELGRSVKAVESDLFRARKEFKILYSMNT